MNDHPKLGQLITTVVNRDAIHMAVAPVIAGEPLRRGQHIGVVNGKATKQEPHIGVVDPFLKHDVDVEEQFWLLLYPGSITSLRHEWTHPAFVEVETPPNPSKVDSEKWMRAWAMKYMVEGYYDDDEKPDETTVYYQAIEAGYSLYVGSNMKANSHIDDTWWDHWENITGGNGKRGQYFRCGC